MSANVFLDSKSQSTGQYENPPSVKYSNVLPVGTPASSNVSNFYPNNGAVFAPGGTSVIRIPINADAFLDAKNSFLQFTVTNATKDNTGADIPVSLDSSVYSMISAYRLIGPDGLEIDRITDYNTLMAVLSDFELSVQYRGTIGRSAMGYAKELYVLSSKTNTTAGNKDEVVQDYTPDSDTAVLGGTTSRTFMMPLTLGLLGSGKYIPLKYITGGGLTIEITLASANSLFKCPASTDVPSYQVSNVAYVAQLINFNDIFDSQFKQLLDIGGVQIHSPTWHHYANNATGASYTIPIAERARSIKSIIISQRLISTYGGNNTIKRVSSRSRNGLTSYQFRVGSNTYPTQPIQVSATNPSHALSEMYKALGVNHIGDSQAIGNVVDDVNYVDNTGYVAGALADGTGTANGSAEKIGKFAFGYDFESFPGSGLESGINTSQLSLPISLEVTGAGGNPIRIDAFVMIDQVITLMPNGIIVVSR